jgi:predicted site-specific integrase-resolvase
MIPMSSSDYLTATQLCQRWGVCRDTLLRWRKTGKGPAYFRTPGFVLYPLAEVEQYEQANTINPGDQ